MMVCWIAAMSTVVTGSFMLQVLLPLAVVVVVVCDYVFGLGSVFWDVMTNVWSVIVLGKSLGSKL